MPDYLISLPPYVSGLLDGSGNFELGTGVAGIGGVENIIEFDGYAINKKNQADRILITQIEGLADADIRDTREVNPGYDGERAFNSYYGGRTIVLTGKIRTGTLNKLRDMQEGLKGVFSTLQEKSLVFRFPSAPERDIYINCRKSQPIVMSEIQTGWTFERDFQITLRASDPRFFSVIEQTTTQDFFVDDNFSTNPQSYLYQSGGYGQSWFNINLVEDTTTQSTGVSRISSDTSNFPTWNVSTGTLSFATTGTYRFYYQDDVQGAKFASTLKMNIGATKQGVIQCGKRISGTAYIYGGCDIGGNSVAITYKSASGSVTSVSAPYTPAINTTYWIKTELDANDTVTAGIYISDPQVGSPNPVATVSLSIPTNLRSELGTGGHGTASIRAVNAPSNLTIDDFVFEPYGDLTAYPMSVTNNGTYTSSPSIYLDGPLVAAGSGGEALSMYNTSSALEVQNNNQLIINAKSTSVIAVPSGNRLVIDTGEHTMNEFSGSSPIGNAFSQFDINSEWVQLPAGTNQFIVAPQAPGSKLSVTFVHRDTFF